MDNYVEVAMTLLRDEEIQRLLFGGLVVVMIALGLAWAIPGARAAEPRTLLNVSYDPTRELYQAVNEAFAKGWDGYVQALGGEDSFAAIRRVMVLGPVVRVELVLPDGTVLESETTRETRERLSLRRGLEVSVFLRRAKVFVGAG